MSNYRKDKTMVMVKAEKSDNREIESTVTLEGSGASIFTESASAIIALLGALKKQSDELFANVSMVVLGYVNEQMDELVDSEIDKLAKERLN